MAIGADRLVPGNINTGGGGGGGNSNGITLGPVNLSIGANVVAFSGGVEPRVANFFKADGWPVSLLWKPTPGSETTSITVNTTIAYNGITINIITY